MRKILIVDDDTLTRRVLQASIQDEDIHVRQARDGQTAMEEVRNAFYDLILLDVNLPDANGLDLLERIKALSRSTGVIMISGDPSESNRTNARERGAACFIEKPFDLAEVNAIVRSVLRGSEASEGTRTS